MMQLLKEHKGLVAITIIFLILSTLFNIINPLHEAPDEIRHYRYIRYLADFQQLPVQSGEAGNAQAHHPPLYYLTAALATFWVHPSDPLAEPDANPFWGYHQWDIGTDNKNLYIHVPRENFPYSDEALAAHLARFITTLFGAGAVIVTYLLTLEVLPNDRTTALVASALTAFNPQFSYLSGAIINDVPAGLMGGILTLLSVQLVTQGVTLRRIITSGIVYGLAVLTKVNLVAMVGVVGLAIIFGATPQASGNNRIFWGEIIKKISIVLSIGIIISGWFFARNYYLYGDLTGMSTLEAIWGGHNPADYLKSLGPELVYFWTSLWGRFGYGQMVMPSLYYWATGILCLVGVVGAGMRVWISGSNNQEKRVILLLLITVIGNFLIVLVYLLTIFAGAMGRFFFPAFPAFATIIAGGWVWLGNRWKISGALPSIVSILLISASLLAIFGLIKPAYALPRSIDIAEDHSVLAPFSDNIELISITQSAQDVSPGGELTFDFTWRIIEPTTERYHFFIHLINHDGIIVAQRDTYLGTGTYPSDLWMPGHAFIETVSLDIPISAYTPDQCAVLIGFYNDEKGNLPTGDDLTYFAGNVTISPLPGHYPNSTNIRFSDAISLIGFEIDRRVIEPGDEVHVTLYWRGEKNVDEANLTSFIKLIHDWQQISGSDGYPLTNPPETTQWVNGEVYEEQRSIKIPENAQSGSYMVWLGFYTDELINLDVYREGVFLGDHYELVELLVVSP